MAHDIDRGVKKKKKEGRTFTFLQERKNSMFCFFYQMKRKIFRNMDYILSLLDQIDCIMLKTKSC